MLPNHVCRIYKVKSEHSCQNITVKLLEFVAITAEAIKALSTIFLQHMGLSSHDIMEKYMCDILICITAPTRRQVPVVLAFQLQKSFNDFNKTPKGGISL